VRGKECHFDGFCSLVYSLSMSALCRPCAQLDNLASIYSTPKRCLRENYLGSRDFPFIGNPQNGQHPAETSTTASRSLSRTPRTGLTTTLEIPHQLGSLPVPLCHRRCLRTHRLNTIPPPNPCAGPSSKSRLSKQSQELKTVKGMRPTHLVVHW